MTEHPWRPSATALSAESVQETLCAHRTVAILFWATWNEGLDRALEASLKPLFREFGDRITFRSVDFDDRRIWPFVQSSGVVNLPAIGFWKGGTLERVVIGVRSPAAWRDTFVDVLRSPRQWRD
ncbi:MAG: hypothetical protein L6R43_06550 [Planctomycetes bacterium]|nr:hypothetical protein [Planctomycetota bacterium]